MFLSREEREERKKKKADLTDQIDDLKDSIDEKEERATTIINDYIALKAGMWEYLELTESYSIFRGGKNELEERGGLKQLGKEGWELASVLPPGKGEVPDAIFYFKRKIIPLSKEIENELDKINQEKSQLQSELDHLSKELEQMS